MFTTQTEVRDAFWYAFSVDGNKPREYRGKSQNQLPTDVRCAFVDFVDGLARDGQISEALASRVTL
jgi:hypothetical protein